MENLIVSGNVILPLLIVMCLGCYVRQAGMMDEHSVVQMNKVVFRIFLPVQLFYNIYQTQLSLANRPKLILYTVCSLFVMYLLTFLIIRKLEPSRKKQSVLIQAVFRSNYILFGIPITTALYGAENAGISSLLTAFVVPIFNILAIVTFALLRNEKLDIRQILKNIVTNPLVIGAVLGLLLMGTDVTLPAAIDRAVSNVTGAATPLALFILGASFNFKKAAGEERTLAIGTLGRLIVVPLIFVSIGILLGFRTEELAVLLSIYASPAAVASFSMAQEMHADADLAGLLVVTTSVFSIVTMFLWIFVLKQMRFL